MKKVYCFAYDSLILIVLQELTVNKTISGPLLLRICDLLNVAKGIWIVLTFDI